MKDSTINVFDQFQNEMSKVSASLSSETKSQLGIAGGGVAVGLPSVGPATIAPGMVCTPTAMRVKDTVNYIRTEVAFPAGKAKVDLLDPNKDQEIGITTFDGDKLADIENQVVTHVSVGFVVDAAAAKAGLLAYLTNFSSKLRNSELVIKQEGYEKLRLPLTLFDPRTVGNNAEDRIYKLDKPFTLLGKKNIQMYIDSPTGTATATHDYVEVMTYGLQTV